MSETGPEFTSTPQTINGGELPMSVESSSVQTPELSQQEIMPQSDTPGAEIDYNMTIGGPNYMPNRLDPARYAREQALVAHMDSMREKLMSAGVESESTSSVTDAITEQAAPAEIEATVDHTIKSEGLNEYTEALNYDMTNPEDPEYTPEQLKNIEIMEGIQKKYPHAFVEYSSEDGRKFLLLDVMAYDDLRNFDGANRNAIKSYILSSNGLTQVFQDKFNYKTLDKIKLELIFDTKSTNEYGGISIKGEEGSDISLSHIQTLDYKDVNLSSFKTLLNNTEQMKLRDAAEEAKKRLSAEDVLSAL